MNIGVFAYNFPHWKTQEGIHNLILSGYKPKVIMAADPVELNLPKSKIRTTPKDLYLTHPKKIARRYQIDYEVVIHNSQETSDLVREYDLDVGVILGARILKPIAFQNFSIGVLNMHPGILPENRGLDTLKWAIVDDISQGVTTHLIDSKIDRGFLIQKQEINIYKDDTLLDVNLRIQYLEQKLMIESLGQLKHLHKWKGIPHIKFPELGKGNYHSSISKEAEKDLYLKFKDYKNKHA
jgi:methionyl-tRNA formyltransferase